MMVVVLAACWIALPRDTADLTTGSITAAMLPPGELSCDQILYLEEVELLSGSACS
jgi:hypothetical protein